MLTLLSLSADTITEMLLEYFFPGGFLLNVNQSLSTTGGTRPHVVKVKLRLRHSRINTLVFLKWGIHLERELQGLKIFMTSVAEHEFLLCIISFSRSAHVCWSRGELGAAEGANAKTFCRSLLLCMGPSEEAGCGPHAPPSVRLLTSSHTVQTRTDSSSSHVSRLSQEAGKRRSVTSEKLLIWDQLKRDKMGVWTALILASHLLLNLSLRVEAQALGKLHKCFFDH